MRMADGWVIKDNKFADNAGGTYVDNGVPLIPGTNTYPAPPWVSTSYGLTPRALFPDLLSIRNIGAADGWRGRVVRGFFRILRAVTGV
jgi:hypothetical protein